MKTLQKVLFISVVIGILLSCTTSAYIMDSASAKRQRQMMSARTGRGFLEGGLAVFSTVLAASTGVVAYQPPAEQAYRKMVIQNMANDTLFINMVTDYRWKDTAYADIRDIIMPPHEKARIIVPMGINYNVYFRKEYNDTTDEKIEVNTAGMRKIKLKPTGVLPDSIRVKLLPQ